MKKKVAIIGTVGVPANYGGFETLTENLIQDLNEDYDLTVYCSGKRYAKAERKETYKKARLKYLPLDANGIQSIPYDTISIIHALFFADVLLVLGVAGAWVLPFVRWFTNKKIIISIDGIEWKRDKWNMLAKWYLFWAEGLAVRYSHIDISDNEAIQDYTAMRYGTLSRIIEYGADHTMKVLPEEEDIAEFPFLKGDYAFKVCRIVPENNVHTILEAYAQLASNTLVIVGNWTNSDYGKEIRKKYGIRKNIILLDPIYDQRKLDVLRGNASLYIHGHSAGGTNPSLVEAMYLGLPIISYGVAYNKVTTQYKGLYFRSLEDLKILIEQVTPDSLQVVANNMKTVAEKRYKWSIISNKYNYLIQEALGVREKAPVISATTDLNYDTLLDMGVAHLKHQDEFFIRR